MPQEETLRGKAKCLANIEELERLVPLMKEALREERSGLEASLGDAARASAEEACAAKVADAESVRTPALSLCGLYPAQITYILMALAHLMCTMVCVVIGHAW